MSSPCVRAARSLALLASALAIGCSVPVAQDLDENDANEAVVALETHGVVASKEPDPQHEGRWLISVPQEEATGAAGILSRESLPATSAPGVLDAMGKGSIVPSRLAEHAKLVAGTAGDLERSLRSVNGVLSARVHLAVPLTDALDTDAEHAPHPTASVLVRHRGAQPPIALEEIQRLVAGAVPGLEPAQVSVVTTPVPSSARSVDHELTRFGPVTIARSSLTALRTIVSAAVLLNLALLGAIALLWSRMRKAEAGIASAHAEAAQGKR
jgi:type III secretion protein J